MNDVASTALLSFCPSFDLSTGVAAGPADIARARRVIPLPDIARHVIDTRFEPGCHLIWRHASQLPDSARHVIQLADIARHVIRRMAGARLAAPRYTMSK